MRVDVSHQHVEADSLLSEPLRILVLISGVAEVDRRIAEPGFGVIHIAVVAGESESLLEAERAVQPLERRSDVLVEQVRRDRCGFSAIVLPVDRRR